jgi:hypothetical protein
MVMGAYKLKAQGALQSGAVDPAVVGYRYDRLGRAKRQIARKLYSCGGTLEDIRVHNITSGYELILPMSSIHNVHMQTDFMHTLFDDNLQRAIRSASSPDNSDLTRLSIYHDLTYRPCNSHYKMQSSILNEVTFKTVGVLVTYQDRLDTAAYTAHFRCLLDRHPGLCRFARVDLSAVPAHLNLEQKLNQLLRNPSVTSTAAVATHIMDHSDAQRKGLYRAVGLRLLEIAGLATNDGAATARFDALRVLAAERVGREVCLPQVKGCDFHLAQTFTKIMSNGRFVPPEKREQFKRLYNDWKTALRKEEFKALSNAMKRLCPRTNPWISWWAQPMHAELIFPSYSRLPDRVRHHPQNSTNNRAEALHRDQARVQDAKQPLALAIRQDLEYYSWAKLEHEAEERGEATGATTRRRALARRTFTRMMRSRSGGASSIQDLAAPPTGVSGSTTNTSTAQLSRRVTSNQIRAQHERAHPEWDTETGGKIADTNWRADEVEGAGSTMVSAEAADEVEGAGTTAVSAEPDLETLVEGEIVYAPYSTGQGTSGGGVYTKPVTFTFTRSSSTLVTACTSYSG